MTSTTHSASPARTGCTPSATSTAARSSRTWASTRPGLRPTRSSARPSGSAPTAALAACDLHRPAGRGRWPHARGRAEAGLACAPSSRDGRQRRRLLRRQQRTGHCAARDRRGPPRPRRRDVHRARRSPSRCMPRRSPSSARCPSTTSGTRCLRSRRGRSSGSGSWRRTGSEPPIPRPRDGRPEPDG